MSDKWIENVQFELTQIERLIPLSEEIRETIARDKPTYPLTAAEGKILHDFYHGAEHILKMIAQAVNGELPAGQAWHVDLLRQMMVAREKRTAVISSELAFELREYLTFRHFFRHAYGYTLDWDRMVHLIEQLPAVHERFATSIIQFINHYQTKP